MLPETEFRRNRYPRLNSAATATRGIIPTADRISDLPDPILCQILSSLPTKLAVTTTVLSRRWKSLHLQLSTLNFNDEAFQHFDSFINFIYTTVSARDVTFPLHSLTFKCTNANSLIHNQLIINGALDFVFDGLPIENLNSLEITFHENLNILLPRRICSCKNLRVLYLCNAVITDSSCSSGLSSEFDFNFPFLKILHWNSVLFLTPECFVKFISSCPELVKLHAYSLQYISIAYDSDEKFKFKPFPKLATARIFDYNVPITFLSEVQSLHLQMNRRWIPCKQLPLFHRLTNIDIIFTNVLLEEEFKWLLQLLQHCPILQHFTIQNGYQNQMVGNYWIDPPGVPQCLSLQLKTFFLRGYDGNENEFQFVRYIMQNSKVLQAITILSTLDADINRKHQMLRKLSLTTMASTTCELLFY